MKVKVEFTVEVTDEQRDVIGAQDEPRHRATWEEVRAYLKQRGTDGLEDLVDEQLSWLTRFAAPPVSNGKPPTKSANPLGQPGLRD